MAPLRLGTTAERGRRVNGLCLSRHHRPQAPADIDNDVDDVGNDAAPATPNLSTPAPFENSNHGFERGSQVT